MYGARWLQALLPRGLAWQIAPGSSYERFVRATGMELERLAHFFREVRAQALPLHATLLLREWSQLFSLRGDLNDTERRQLATTYFTAVGNQSTAYVQEQFAKSGLPVQVEVFDSPSSECGASAIGGECFGVGQVIVLRGTVRSAKQLREALRLWEYYRPLHAVVHVEVELKE